MEAWKECRLGDYCDFQNGYAFKSSEFKTNGEYKIVKIKELKDGLVKFFDDSASVDIHDIKEFEKYKIYRNDVLFSLTGDPVSKPNPLSWVGRVSIYRSDENALLNQRTCKIKKSDEIDNQFLYYYFRQWENFYALASKAIGSASQANISTNTIADTIIKLPPLPTQQKIAAILSSLDDKIELNNKINTNLEQQIEALLLNYLSKRETTSVKLGDYLYIKGRIGWKGLKKNEYLSESNYRIINGETLTKSGIDWNKAGYISEERYTESPEIMLQIGDILLSKDGTIGKIGYVDELELPTSVASGIFVIRNNNPSVISTTFIYYLLKSKLFDSFIIARTEGSVIPHLYQKDFMDFEFPLSSPELMTKFEQTTSPMFNQIINNLKENKKLNFLRDSLLPKLMNGEIEVGIK